MKDTMGIIISENQIHLNELTERRSVEAMPVGGRYRLIDFMLSNMVNSGIINVGVCTKNNYTSLMDHIGTGKPWDLNRKNYGLFILPPFVNRELTTGGHGNIDTLFGVINYLKKSSQQYAVITDGNIVCNMTFNDALENHKNSGADISIIYNETQKALPKGTVLDTDSSGRVVIIQKNPRNPISKKYTMGTYILERVLLESLIEECVSRGKHDFVMDILIENVNKLKIFAYKLDGYVNRVDSIKAYYKVNMDLLNQSIRDELFGSSNNPIYTKVKDQVPTKYGDNAVVNDSLIADGCIIDGEVDNSIIFRAVHIDKGVKIKNCIIMQNTFVQEGTELEHVVIDKECVVRMGKRLIGQEDYPVIVGKRTIV